MLYRTQERAQIPAYTDRWMMGDRYGDLVKTYFSRKANKELAVVKLDKSGKTLKFILADCEIFTINV